MPTDIYTLPELVDLALKTPEVGAVNFNILRIVLHKILSECNLESKTAEWKPIDKIQVVTQVVEDKEFPVHPVLVTKKEQDKDALKYTTVESEEKERSDSRSSTDKDEEASSKQKSVSTQDVGIMTSSTDVSDEETMMSEDIQVPKTVTKKRKFRQVKHDDIIKQPDSTKGVNAGLNLWHVWQVKRLLKRIEAVEEELNSLVDVVDDLKEFKNSRRPKFEEGEKFQRGLAGGALGRDEFEESIEDLGEAIARLAIKQRIQGEEFVSTNEDILKEINDKVSIEDHNKSQEPIDKKLKILGIEIKNIQKLINDVLYPAASGITKCVSCGRKAHLPFRCVVEKQASKISTPSAGDFRPRLKREKDHPDLRFTHACLRRYTEEEKRLKVEGGIQEHGVRDHQIKRSEEKRDNIYVAKLEPICDVSSLSRDFPPLRMFPDISSRRAISIPAIRPQQVPVSISIFGNEETQICIKRSGNKRESTDSNF